jgi:uncharacterized linocin/CFP29 family protein
MEVLNQSSLPFSNSVWSVIEEEIGEYLAKRLTLRSVVDFRSEYSFETDAIATKNLQTVISQDGLNVATREPIKMMEVKKHFVVPTEVIEDIKRNKSDFDTDALMEAANAFAAFENQTILNGNSSANIEGLLSSVENRVEANNTKEILMAVAKSLGIFNANFVDAPFKLVVSSTTMAKLYTQSFDGISLKSKIDEILGSDAVVINQEIGDEMALVVAQRGGDFEFYSGMDVSLGFEKETSQGVELFLMQTFAFRNLAPEALVVIDIQ